ncbi:RNA-binding protein [Clostridium bovifaecis]|uniref:RNA-binding protein n=1 Tax=Clostridium bovifaecis TaxID=2184719 RepID=A0A6I6EX05_9CLOT|nr:RNA-binding protein [Clostridium bovifaecis]
MKKEELLGRVVYSKVGRDSGKAFIILDKIDDNYVSIIDGDLRKVEKPKKKKIKHLNITNDVIEDIKKLIISKESLSNAEVKKYLGNRDVIKEG